MIKCGDTAVIKYNNGIEDFVNVGDVVTIIQILKKGDLHPGIDKHRLSEDHYWIDKIGMSPFAGLTIMQFEQ